jgi:predicted DNA-binding transcriptional regulator AlpA
MRRLNTTSVMERLDVSSRETLRQLVKRGVLPPPLRDEGGGCNYWLESDITAYLEGQATKRAAAVAANDQLLAVAG